MPEFKIQRVNYFEGQRLRVDDFKDEQGYHLEMRRRHNKNLHNWGIATGLKVNWEKGTNKITVSPGMAIDVDGREIVLDEPWVVENILTLTAAASGDFILTLAYEDEKVSSATDGLCSSGPTRVAEMAALYLRAEIGEFIRDGKEVPLAGIKITNCRIDGDPDDSVREETSLGKAVRITGDTMTGSLTIDLSAITGENTQKSHLHLIALTESANLPAGISMNHETIKFWQTDAKGQFSKTTAHLSARGLLVEKPDDENAGDTASYGITLKDSSKTWQIFQAAVKADDPFSSGLVIGDVIKDAASKDKLRPRLKLDSSVPIGKISIGTIDDQTNVKVFGKDDVTPADVTKRIFAVDVDGIVNAKNYYQNGSPWAELAWKNATKGIYYSEGNVSIGADTVPADRKLKVTGVFEVTGDVFIGGNLNGNGNVNIPTGRLTFNAVPGAVPGQDTAGIAATDSGSIYGEHDAGTEVSRLVIDIGDNVDDAIVLRTSATAGGSTVDMVKVSHNKVLLTPTSGKVGIGTLTPTANLDVAGTLKTAGNSALEGNVNVGTAASAANLDVTGALTVKGASALNGNVNVGTATNAANVDVTGALTVNSTSALNGNVNVGTANKTANLDVSGTSALSQLVTIGTAAGSSDVLLIVHGKIQATALIETSPEGGGGGPTATLAAERIMSSAEKNFGIGTDAPKAKLHVRGDKRRFDALLINDGMSGSKDLLLQKEARTATLQSSEGNLMTLDLENLNVGIGTAKVPTEKLEVAGNVKIEGEALIMENVTIGAKDLPADLEVMGQLFGAAKGPAAEAFRIAVGHTPTPALWKQEPDKENVVYVDVDCSSGGFTATPFYFTSLHGDSDHWATVGVTSIHKSTAKGFRVFVHQKGITAERARELNWQVKWLGVGN